MAFKKNRILNRLHPRGMCFAFHRQAELAFSSSMDKNRTLKTLEQRKRHLIENIFKLLKSGQKSR